MPYNDPDPEKDKARKMIYNARRRGLLKKPEMCSSCFEFHDNIQAHHDDYDKPLDVIWLCSSCHKDRHYLIQKCGLEYVLQSDHVFMKAVSVSKELI